MNGFKMRKRKRHAGYILCKILNKKIKISLDAIPFDDERPDWLCDCGKYVRSDPYNHTCWWRGMRII